MVEENKTRPVVIKKVAKHGDDHHGGSWKIAFADFMTAMFAIFLVLWLLLALDDDQRQGIGQYFRDPQAAHPPASRDI
ncbi:flagellar motor protein MotB, partial [Rhodopseudomonas palustris]